MVLAMKKRNFATVALLTALALPWPAQAQKYDKDNLPRLPGAELLVKGYLPDRFLLTTEDKTLTLQEDEIGFDHFPNISADGSIVASAHRIPGDPSRAPWLIASTYSVKDGKWTDHPEFEGVWRSIAISPDGSKLACVTRERWQRAPLDPPRFLLRVLDLRTGKISVVTESSKAMGSPTWSPDGRRIAFDMVSPSVWIGSNIWSIYVADLDTGKISPIGIGLSPSWSPSENGSRSLATSRMTKLLPKNKTIMPGGIMPPAIFRSA
ncbi:MAG: hypothetical protein ABSD43_00310 [Terracidiphilus sp.]|jgi:hypothetical protein